MADCAAGKKRLCALAEWYFGEGAAYCEFCEKLCQECPRRNLGPESLEGKQIWSLVLKLRGQLRVASGMSVQVIGWDFSAAFGLADALGIDRLAVAEFLPALEAIAVHHMNQGLKADV